MGTPTLLGKTRPASPSLHDHIVHARHPGRRRGSSVVREAAPPPASAPAPAGRARRPGGLSEPGGAGGPRGADCPAAGSAPLTRMSLLRLTGLLLLLALTGCGGEADSAVDRVTGLSAKPA